MADTHGNATEYTVYVSVCMLAAGNINEASVNSPRRARQIGLLLSGTSWQSPSSRPEDGRRERQRGELSKGMTQLNSKKEGNQSAKDSPTRSSTHPYPHSLFRVHCCSSVSSFLSSSTSSYSWALLSSALETTVTRHSIKTLEKR